MIKINLKGKSQARYLNPGLKRRSIIVKRNHGHSEKNIFDYIRIGSSFSRTRSDKAVETAHITGVSTDNFGIPHIRYDMKSKKPFTTSSNYDGSKMLALPTFIDLFEQRQSQNNLNKKP